MKLRNQLLALFCVLAFVAVGYLYVRTWVVQKPFGVILFVSDGLVARQITMARLFDGGADYQLALESFPNLALLRNAANDFAVPDDAAVGTALATGFRGNHRALSMNGAGQPLESIASLARRQGRAFGLVTNGSLTSPLPAAFYAHAREARESDALALQMTEKFRPDVALGGGEAAFVPAGADSARGGRRDGRNLAEEMQKAGIEVVRTKAELENLPPYHPAPIVGLFAPKALAFANDIEAASRQPSLADMVRRAITFLQGNRGGYFLVVDASLVGAAAEGNEGERTIGETIVLDRAVAMAMKYAGEKSLILAVGKHSTGGLSMNGYPLRQDHGMALLGASAAGYPYLTWATGPKGPNSSAALTLTPTTAPPSATPAPGNPRQEPAAFQTPSGMNNAEDVLALGRGKGSERLRGFMNNTQIFEVLRDAL